MISQQAKSRCSETGGKKKKKGKLFSTGQNSTAEVICFDADTQRLSGKTNSDTFFQSTF